MDTDSEIWKAIIKRRNKIIEHNLRHPKMVLLTYAKRNDKKEKLKQEGKYTAMRHK